MAEHKFADLLRMAADNADQLFECDEVDGSGSIISVLYFTNFNWRPVKQTKKIKRWLWADKYGVVTNSMYSENEIGNITWENTTLEKLLWSDTEFEVDDE